MEKLLEEFSIGLFFWQTVLFLALLFLLRKFAWKPILNAVNEREEGIKNAHEDQAELVKEGKELLELSGTLFKNGREYTKNPMDLIEYRQKIASVLNSLIKEYF